MPHSLWLLLVCALCLFSVTAADADFRPPILPEADFGTSGEWLGFQADKSTVLYAPDYRDWKRTPGGLATDESVKYQGKATGRLTSLKQGFLAFHPIKIQRSWDFLEFALHNETPTDGLLQIRFYYGIGGSERFWNQRHGYFFAEIPLDFTGWKTFRLERDDFTPYGGPVGWIDDQLVALGLHVTRAPTRLTAVHLADVHFTSSPIVLTAARDLLRTQNAPLTFNLTVENRSDQQRRARVRVTPEAFAYGTHKEPFEARLTRNSFVVPPKGKTTFQLKATPRAESAPGDAMTYVVCVEDASEGEARGKARLHAVKERAHRTLHSEEAAAKTSASRARASTVPPRPPLTDAEETLRWLLNAARDYAFEGDKEGGQRAAEALKELGDPQRGYPALCNQPFYLLTGKPGNEPAMESHKTWYQAFFWVGPIAAARAYDLLYASGFLTETDKRQIEDNFLRPFGKQATLSLSACANGQEQILASVLAVGLVTQDPDMIRLAIDGPFGWKHAIGHDMLNGISMEGSMTYMWYVTWSSLAEAADMASHSGIDLFHLPCPVLTDRNHTYEADQHQPSRNSSWQRDTEPETRVRSFMDCLHGMIAVTYPNWRLPKLHDSEDDVLLPVPTVYFRNPLTQEETRALLGDTEAQLAPGYSERFMLPHKPGKLKRPSVNLQAIGLAILRNNDGNRPEDQYLLLDYGPHGGVHGHKDKLQLVYWRHGKELAPDLPICDLDKPAWSQYYQQTASHNTLVLDGVSQLTSAGEACLTFAPLLPDAQVTELEATAAYAAQQARARRLAFLSRDYALIIDRVVSPLPHTIDFVLHGASKDATLTTSVPLESKTGPLAAQDAYRWITRRGEGKAAGDWRADWDMGEGIGLRLLALGTEPTQVLTGKGYEGYRRGHIPIKQPDGTMRYLPDWEGPHETLPDAVLIARREASPGTTRFVTLLEGYKEKPAVLSATLEKNTTRVTLAGGITEVFSWQGGDESGQATACEFRRERGGELTHVALIHGQRVMADGRVLLSAEAPMTGCAVEYVGEEARITALEGGALELLPPHPIRRVTVNGMSASFQTVAGRLRVQVAALQKPRL